MSILSSLLKVAAVAAGVVIVQRVIDRTVTEGVYRDLDALQERIRRKPGLVGTVRANVRVEAKELIERYAQNITYVAALKEFHKNVEIYIESIPD